MMFMGKLTSFECGCINWWESTHVNVHLNAEDGSIDLGKPMIMSCRWSCCLPSWVSCRLMPGEGENLPLIRRNLNLVANSIWWRREFAADLWRYELGFDVQSLWLIQGNSGIWDLPFANSIWWRRKYCEMGTQIFAWTRKAGDWETLALRF